MPLGLRLLQPGWTDRVPSPPYDALTPTERAAWVAANPDSYLAVTQGPEGADDAEVDRRLRASRHTLDRLIDAGAFGALRPAQFYVLGVTWQGRRHLAVVGGVPVADIEAGGVRLHERVRPDRAGHLARHLDVVGAQSSPLHLAHRPAPDLRRAVATIAAADPVLEVRAGDGLIQEVWTVPPSLAATLGRCLRDVALYLIDGHHRTAAAIAHRRHAGPGPADRVLAAVHDADDLDNRAFHRLLVLGDAVDDVLATIATEFPTRTVPTTGATGDPALASRSDDELALYAGGEWHLVTVPAEPGRLGALDPARFQRLVDRALRAPAYDDRLRFRPGILGLPELQAEADRAGAVLGVMRPVAVPDLLAVADEGLIMPPKSTYFVPKPRSGLFVRPVGVGA